MSFFCCAIAGEDGPIDGGGGGPPTGGGGAGGRSGRLPPGGGGLVGGNRLQMDQPLMGFEVISLFAE